MGKKGHKRPKSVWRKYHHDRDVNFKEIWEAIQRTKWGDPCWCGSGEKYQNCHLHRAQEAPLRIQEYIKVLRKIYDKGYCLHPQTDPTTCVGSIVKAHSVQRNGGLNRIADKGHVYTFASEKNISNTDLITPTLVGIRKASTFTGFCSFHDNAIFEPVEKSPFRETPEHTFLLGYRALCHEYFKKKMVAELILPHQQKHLDKGKSPDEQMQIQYLLDHLLKLEKVGLKDLAFYKGEYDRALLLGDFSKVSYYILRLDNIPNFLCSSPHMPTHDFTGKRTLQNIWTPLLEQITSPIR